MRCDTTVLTREQVRRVDALTVGRYGLPGVVLMENAARGLADEVRGASRVAGGLPVRIVCGGGNNGGDGWAAARHLHNAGADVQVLFTRPAADLAGDAGVHARVTAAMGVPCVEATPQALAGLGRCVLVDALLGTGLTDPPRDDAAALIDAMNRLDAVRVAADVPSGLDADTGRPTGRDAVRAEVTVTFVALRAASVQV